MDQNWDGYGARPVDFAAVSRATQFLRALPPQFPNRRLGRAGGTWRLNWYGGPGRAFTITIHGDGELKYATLFGRDRNLWLGPNLLKRFLKRGVPFGKVFGPARVNVVAADGGG